MLNANVKKHAKIKFKLLFEIKDQFQIYLALFRTKNTLNTNYRPTQSWTQILAQIQFRSSLGYDLTANNKALSLTMKHKSNQKSTSSDSTKSSPLPPPKPISSIMQETDSQEMSLMATTHVYSPMDKPGPEKLIP